MTDMLYLIIAIAVIAVAVVLGFVATSARRRGRGVAGTDVITRPSAPPGEQPAPGTTDSLEAPEVTEPEQLVLDRPESAAGRLVRLRLVMLHISSYISTFTGSTR